MLPLESGNLRLDQTKFPVFWQNFQIPCVFPDRFFCVAISPVFPVFLCCGYTDIPLTCTYNLLYYWDSQEVAGKIEEVQ